MPYPMLEYDAEADVVTVTMAQARRRPRTIEFRPGLLGDFDGTDRLVRLQVHEASRHYSRGELDAFAPMDDTMTLREASRLYGLAVTTLRDRIADGRLAARKVGRDWMVTGDAVETYLNSRGPAGRPSPLAAPRGAARLRIATGGEERAPRERGIRRK